LEAGKSTRSDVMKVLGSPVRDVSDVLSEYRGSGNEQKIYVQYVNPSGIIARIEILLVQPMSQSEATQMVGLHSPPAVSIENDKGRLVDYYGGKFIVLTHESAESNSLIMRIAYYSRELYESASSNGTNQNGGNQQTPPPVTTTTTTTTPQPKGSHTLTISDLQFKKENQSIVFSFKFFDQAGDVDPNKGRVIIPLRILCGTDAGINITWSALAVDKQDEQHGTVHVPVFTELFPSGQNNNCEVTISMQDLAGNVSNQLKTRMKM
jgi:hypothetical protein